MLQNMGKHRDDRLVCVQKGSQCCRSERVRAAEVKYHIAFKLTCVNLTVPHVSGYSAK